MSITQGNGEPLDFDAELRRIREAYPNPLDSRRRAALSELYSRPQPPVDPDLDEIEAVCALAGCAVELAPDRAPEVLHMADALQDVAQRCPRDEMALRVHAFARYLRAKAMRVQLAPEPMLPLVLFPVLSRPRESRERRHVARATSSSDSGDPDLPQRAGQAVCPVCSNLELVRRQCRFCGGAGHVERERRNRYKRGEA
jgi:hypothetical protein